jgi:hypothetical protein
MSEEQEFIHTANKKEKGAVSVLDILRQELHKYMETALDYKKKIEEAKTDYKKNYYNKKLKKNNADAVKILTAIERVEKSQDEKTNKTDK